LALGGAEDKGASGSAVALLAGFIAAAGFCGLSATGFAGANVTGFTVCGLSGTGLDGALSGTP
jgi:hypothetical protein